MNHARKAGKGTLLRGVGERWDFGIAILVAYRQRPAQGLGNVSKA